MTLRGAAVYGVGGVLLVACLAAANMPQEPADTPSFAVRAARPATPDMLAAEVSMQAVRLHQRMAQAPAPVANARNPFSFNVTHALGAAPGVVRAAVADEAPAPMPALPPLTLVGVAEDTTPAGPKRTAIITLRQAQGDPEQSRGVGGDADALFMVGEGDAVGDRYRVTKIGADAVELEDVLTKGYRRLALR